MTDPARPLAKSNDLDTSQNISSAYVLDLY